VTDHTAFKKTKLSEIRSVMARDPILYDSRGMFRPERCSQEGFIYIGLGRPDMTVQKTG
jgi:UDP-N-acetyl-D-mannosaminuronate dehydrogenase